MSFGAIYHHYYDNQAYGRQDGKAGAGRTNKDPEIEDLDQPPIKDVLPDDMSEEERRAILLAEAIESRM